MIYTARDINHRRPEYVLEFLRKRLAGIADPLVTVLGVAYRGNIDDTRESPALAVLAGLQDLGVSFKIYDPHVSHFSYETCNLMDAFAGSDCAIVLADHDEFRFLYPRQLSTLMRTRQVIDTCCCLDRSLWAENGFNYYLLGAG